MNDLSSQPEPTRYDRPNQPWICGRTAQGESCAFGPGESGVCPALAECQPVERSGLWICDRPEARGGLCDQGPTPDGKCCRSHSCKPVRSLRSLRGVLIRSTAVFALGAVLMTLGNSRRNEWMAPGPLTSHHSQVLSGAAWNNRCESCHTVGNQPVSGLLAAVVGSDLGPTQLDKCMACHDQTIEPELALVAHNVPHERLYAGGRGASDADAHGKEFACAVCHQEHHGPQHAIAAMNNDRCQSCHAQKYESFATDHPNFAMWPYERRTRIAFNHSTHQGKYFAEKGREFSCRQCHIEDATRGVQLTLGYDATCSECHDADITTSTAGGVALLEMPMLDLEAFSAVGRTVDDWPSQAVGDFDGKLPAITKLLVAQDEPARKALGVLGADFDFFDVDIDDEQQLRAAGDVATAVNHLLDKLVAGEESLIESELLLGIDRNAVKQSRRRWRSGQINRAADAPHPGDWFVDDATLSVRYQPKGHADPIIKAWLEAVVQLEHVPLRDALLCELAAPNSPGRCTTCHSIESATGVAATGRLTINWRSHDGRDQPRGFTKFSHTPHLLPQELRDCTACHSLDPHASTSSNYTAHNPAAYTSEFAPISKASCAACHTQTAVGDSCTQCHNYHVKTPL